MGRGNARILCFAAATLGACSTFTAADVDDAGSPDGGVTDAGAPDADAGLTFCSTSTATLCSDFDDNDDVTIGWTAADTSMGATLARSSAASASAPNSLASHIPSSLTGASAARLYLTLVPHGIMRTRLSFDIRANTMTVGSGGRLTIAELLCYTTSANVSDGAFLSYRDVSTGGTQFVVETDIGKSLVPVGAPRNGLWTHYEVDAQWSNKMVYVTVGASDPVAAPLPTACSSYEFAKLNVGLGNSLATPTGDLDALYDNIVYEENPQD